MDEILNRDHIDLAELKENDKKYIDKKLILKNKDFLLFKNLDDYLK